MPLDVTPAVALLTRLPVRIPAAAAERTGAASFPLVGALVGSVVAAPAALLAPVDPTLAALAGLGAAAVLTGALHLDGLADTADALVAPDPARAEAARRDPRIGAGGAVALVLVLGGQAAALAAALRAMDPLPVLASVVTVAAGARLVPVLVTGLATAQGLREGFGAWFSSRIGRRSVLVAALVSAVPALVLSALLGDPRPVATAVVAAVLGTAAGAVLLRWRRGLDGDLLGASIELATLAGFVALAALAGG